MKSGFDKIIKKYLRKKLKADVSHKWCILHPRVLLHATALSGPKFAVSLPWDEYFYKNAKFFRFSHISQCDYPNWKKRWQRKQEQWVVHSSEEWRKKQRFYEKKAHPKKALKICWFNGRGIQIEKKASKQAKNISDREENVFKH